MLHEWVTSVDHKKIGVMYILVAIVFLLIGGAEALVMRLQLMWPGARVISAGSVQSDDDDAWHNDDLLRRHADLGRRGQLHRAASDRCARHGVSATQRLRLVGDALRRRPGVFQLRHRRSAGNRLVRLCPAHGTRLRPRAATDFWILGLLVSGIGSVSGAINLVATVLSLRCPGMSLRKIPLYTWMAFWANVQILFAIPPLTAALVMLWFDRNLGAHFFDAQAGGSPYLWQHLVLVLRPSRSLYPRAAGLRNGLGSDPGFLAQGDLRLRIRGGLDRGHRARQLRRLGPPHVHGRYEHRPSISISPRRAWSSASRPGSRCSTGSPQSTAAGFALAAPMLFCFGFLSMFVIGGLTGIMLAVAPIDYQLSDSYFVVGHFHWVIIGGILMGLFAGLYYWYPKVTGRMYSERLAQWHFWLLLIGFILTFGPMHIAGILGMPRRIFTYQADRGWQLWNVLTGIGALIQAPSYLIFAWNLPVFALNTAPPPARPMERLDPRMGLNLAAASHITSRRFRSVRSRRPLWDLKHPDDPDWHYE